MATFLVTGASGFIGVNLAERLLGGGHRVVAFSPDGIPPIARAEFARLSGEMIDVIGDVRDAAALGKLFTDHRFDAVVAGAAITAGADRERRHPASILEVNLVGVARTLEAAEAAGVKRLVCFSSTAAAGERTFGATPVTEADRPEPISLYGITKAAIEGLAVRWNGFGPTCEMVVARLAAVFGPWERASGVRDTLSPPHQLAIAAVEGAAIAPMPAGGDRDWVDAPYVARALEFMATAPVLPHRIFNIGAGCVWHPRVMVDALAAAGLPLATRADGRPIVFNDDVTRRRVPLSVDRLAAAIGAPPTPADAAAAYARWIATHRAWFAS